MDVKVAAVQIATRLKDVKDNLARGVDLALTAAGSGAQLVVFPELFATGWDPETIKDEYYGFAETLPGPTSEALGRVAREKGIYVSGAVVEKGADPKTIYNTVFLLDPSGKILGRHRKVHLWAAEVDYFTPGDTYDVIDTPFGGIGYLICYDAAFPETARILALSGMTLMLIPLADADNFRSMWEVRTPYIAQANGCHVVTCNGSGIQGDGSRLYGGSRVVDPFGKVLADGGGGEKIVMATIDLDDIGKARAKSPTLVQRRPETYDKILSRFSG